MKPFYLSRIFWVNILSVLLELAQVLLNFQLVPSGTVLVAVNILNVLLRFLTDEAIYVNKPKV